MNGFHTYSFDEIAQRHDLTAHPLLEVVEHFGEADDFWIAGGAVRAFLLNLPISTDVDFFFRTPEAFDRFVAKHAPDKAKRLAETEHHVTFKATVGDKNYKVQAIRIGYYESVEACLDSFDFTICQLGVHKGHLYAGQYALWDLGRKKLALHKLTYGAATVRRLLKYSTQGFTACQGCLVAILRAVGENPAVINSDVQYVD